MRQNQKSSRGQWRLWTLALPIAGLLLLSWACNLPEGLPFSTPPGPGVYVPTSVAQTLAILAVEQTITEADAEPAGTQTPAETGPAATAPGTIMIYMSENTNCRTGQSTSFERITILMKGDEAEAVAVDTSGDYYFIRQPEKLSDFCWLWGAYATPSAPIDSLPKFTPVPTATPGFVFEISYHSNIGLCGGFYALQYQVKNTGSVILESWRTTSIDNSGGADPLPNQQDKFYDISGCTPAGEQEKLLPGESYYVNALYDNDPTGHDLTVTVQVCSGDGLGGNCLSRKLSHAP